MIISLDNLIFAKWALEEENILMLADKNKSQIFQNMAVNRVELADMLG